MPASSDSISSLQRPWSAHVGHIRVLPRGYVGSEMMNSLAGVSSARAGARIVDSTAASRVDTGMSASDTYISVASRQYGARAQPLVGHGDVEILPRDAAVPVALHPPFARAGDEEEDVEMVGRLDDSLSFSTASSVPRARAGVINGAPASHAGLGTLAGAADISAPLVIVPAGAPWLVREGDVVQSIEWVDEEQVVNEDEDSSGDERDAGYVRMRRMKWCCVHGGACQ